MATNWNVAQPISVKGGEVINQEDRDRLAVEIMGWKKFFEEQRRSTCWVKKELYPDPDDAISSWYNDWRPDENIEQSFMLLDKFEQGKTWKSGPASDDQKYGCTVSTPQENFYATGPTRELAICKVLLKTIGAKNA